MNLFPALPLPRFLGRRKVNQAHGLPFVHLAMAGTHLSSEATARRSKPGKMRCTKKLNFMINMRKSVSGIADRRSSKFADRVIGIHRCRAATEHLAV